MVTPILPANGPIIKSLSLPSRYAITHASAYGLRAELAHIEAALAFFAAHRAEIETHIERETRLAADAHG